MIEHPDAPPGKAEKYARRERERRFLLRGVPPGEPDRRVRIEDRYLDGTRLRLRRVTDGTTETRKLTQKIPAADGGPGLITTLYLSEREFEALAALPAAVLTKTRLSFPPLGVDVFDGPLTGLVLAEAEFDDAESASAFTEPEGAVADVTADERFAGGTLARTSAEAVSSALASFGLALAEAAAPRASRG